MSNRRYRFLASLVLAVAFFGAHSGVAGAQQELEPSPTPTVSPSPEPQPQPQPTQPAPGPGPQAPPAPPKPPPPPKQVQSNLDQIAEAHRLELAGLQKQADDLAAQIAKAREVLGELDLQVDDVTERIAGVLKRVEHYRDQLQIRARAAYMGTDSYLSVLVDAKSPSEFLSRLRYLGSANNADIRKLQSLKEEKDALEVQQQQLTDLRRDQRAAIAEMERKQTELGMKLGQMLTVISTLPQQQQILVNGFCFPVMAPFTYSNDFGAFRAGPPVHAHAGNDIFGVWGSPLPASEAGTIIKVGNGGLGGITLWLQGDSGAAYYYAHLSGFYPGVTVGTRVAPCQFIGFLGNTGNARTTPPHVHYEIHPGGKGTAAVNPYPILKATENAMSAALASQVAAGVAGASAVSVNATTAVQQPGAAPNTPAAGAAPKAAAPATATTPQTPVSAAAPAKRSVKAVVRPKAVTVGPAAPRRAV